MKKKLIMYVFGDITTDARVNRAATALSSNFDLTLLSTQVGKTVTDSTYKNILIGQGGTGVLNLLKNLREAYSIIKAQKPDIVYCHDYFSALLAFYLLKTGFKGKIIYDAHELIIPEPGVKDRRLRFFGWFEQRIVKKVDLLVCASSERADKMVEYYKLGGKPLVIRNISQLNVTKDEEVDRIMSSLDDFFSSPEPTVVYAGVVTKTRRIIELEEAVSKLAPRFKLLIVGQGDALHEVIEKANQNAKLKFAYTGKVPYKALGAILSKCDIGFVYYPVNTLNNKFCASNKVYEYASVCLPMISNMNPTIEKELRENNLGIASDDFVSALYSLVSRLDVYKTACSDYTRNNPWVKEAKVLLDNINNIAN